MPRFPSLASLVEWVAAMAVAGALVWVGAQVVRPWLVSSAGTASIEAGAPPEGVPASAQGVPVLLLMDGTALRVGDTQADVHGRIGTAQADPPPAVSRGIFGDRLVHAFERQGTRFYVVTERTEPGGLPKVVGIYLPR